MLLPPGAPPDWARVEIAVPRGSYRLPGITMAGFRQRVPAIVDMAMVAHPCVTLLFDLSDGDGLVYDAHGRRGRGSVVVGLVPGEVRAGGRVGTCLQIRLEPVAAATLLGGSAELSGHLVALEEIWGREAGRVEERLRAAGSWPERFAVATEVLGRRLGARTGRPPVDPEIAFTWRRTLTDRGLVRVDGLADEVGWSRKRLLARFRSQLGITPKHAARLVRFDRAARLLATGHSLAGVAATSGYSDQSHLHREVRAFTGLTPKALAVAPWLAMDDVAWPDSAPGRGGGQLGSSSKDA